VLETQHAGAVTKNWYPGKQELLHILNMCVTLVIQQVMSSHLTILLPVTCLALPYSSTLSHKRKGFRKKKIIEHKICFDFLCKFYLKHFLL
jgi:2-polyprenyl-3-methyl-5-hydroxy-6-metoxy-1,4-benzoquinol methylase